MKDYFLLIIDKKTVIYLCISLLLVFVLKARNKWVGGLELKFFTNHYYSLHPADTRFQPVNQRLLYKHCLMDSMSCLVFSLWSMPLMILL